MDPEAFLQLLRDVTRVAAPQVANIATSSLALQTDYETAQTRVDLAIEGTIENILASRAYDCCGAPSASYVHLIYYVNMTDSESTMEELMPREMWKELQEHLTPGLQIDAPMRDLPGCTRRGTFHALKSVSTDTLASRTLNAAIILSRPEIPVGDGPVARALARTAENAKLYQQLQQQRGAKRSSAASAPAAKAVRTEKAPAPAPAKPASAPEPSSSKVSGPVPVFSHRSRQARHDFPAFVGGEQDPCF